MGYICRLEHNGQVIDLAGSQYKVSKDFVPNVAEFATVTAGGTSANTRRGERKISRKAINVAWSIPIHIYGTTPDAVRYNMGAIQNMLNQAGDEFNPVYFAFHADNDLPFEPSWGQSWRRIEIVTGKAIHGRYGLVGISTAEPNCSLQLNVLPYCYGQPQMALHTTGGVLEDYVGASDGRPIGTMFPPATVNVCTNPIFGRAAWNADWTNSANLLDYKNTNPEFVLWGEVSAYIYTKDADGTYLFSAYAFTAVSNAISFYVKKPDGSAVTALDCAVDYDGTETASTYVSLGNGWYLVYAVITGDTTANTYGPYVQANCGLYLAGCQAEIGAFPTALCHGDMMGCSWGGAVHNSATTRVASQYRTRGAEAWKLISAGAWTYEVTYRTMVALSEYDDDLYLLHVETAGLAVYTNPASDVIAIDGSGHTASGTGAPTIAAGQIVTIHVTFGPGGITIYVNGALVVNQAVYEPPLNMEDLFLFTDSTPAHWCNFTIMGSAIYPREMTATQVAARYANISPLMTAKRRIGATPWVWSLDGDGVMDASTDATHCDHTIIGGIDGDDSADTRVLLLHTQGRGITVASWVSDIYMLYRTGLYQAGSTISVNTSVVEFPSSSTMTVDRYPGEFRDRKSWMICGLTDAGANLWDKLNIDTAGENNFGRIAGVTSDAANAILTITQAHQVPSDAPLAPSVHSSYSDDITYTVALWRTVAGAADVTSTQHQIVFDNILWVGTGEYYILYRGFMYVYNDPPPTSLVLKYPVEFSDAAPGKYLHIVAVDRYPGAIINGSIVTLHEAYITPRYYTL